jgi:alpha-D-xyloside xylohydrolase
VTGDYLLQGFSNGGIRLWVDGALVMDHWRQGWLPWIDVARLHLEAGSRHRLKLEWTKDQNDPVLTLRWKPPVDRSSTSLWSEVGEGIDYYFVYGPRLDAVVAGYRRLTGPAPLIPRWAFGLWQSRQRYQTAQESLEVVAGFRSRGIPFDAIVQDWMYWKEDSWGSHRFDPQRFPDPAGWVRQIHDAYHAHLLISVWGKFYPGTDNFDALARGGFLYRRNLDEHLVDWLGHPYTFYDAFNPAGRSLFWAQVNRDLFQLGVDGWWLDATEPDLLPTPTLDGQRAYMNPTALGPGSRVLNAYSLVQSQGVYEGQRAAAPDQRVLILTRSAFAGQQRYAAATWSGDTTSTWTALRKQIAAGLGFSLSGLPYWTTDAGGFAVPARFSRKHPAAADVEEWRELNTRWFEYAAFCPLLRVHGEAPNREMWEYGGEGSPAYAAQLKADRLRYRLLPYIYSLAGGVTAEAGTIYRPLVMDFPEDPAARNLTDEFLFGPAFLVNPITTYRARSRAVYLPAGTTWFDLWTGGATAGGQTVPAPAPYDAIPVYVRAGSIVPFGPELQYADEKAADPITLRVYAGADGRFTLYEDDGASFGYERGQSARIPLQWDEAAHTLTFGARAGSYPGLLATRTFRVVLITAARPVGIASEPVDRTVTYSGTAQVLRF